MSKKLNLEEVWNQTYPHGKLPQFARDRNFLMEFARQLLELAAENAKVGMEYHDEDISFHTIVNKQSILDTIKQIE